jgi:hypothetical protein
MVMRHGHHLCRNHVELKKKRVAGKIKEKEYKELRVEVKTVVGKTKEKEMETKTRSIDAFQVRQ